MISTLDHGQRRSCTISSIETGLVHSIKVLREVVVTHRTQPINEFHFSDTFRTLLCNQVKIIEIK